jgi:hypothetical protein
MAVKKGTKEKSIMDTMREQAERIEKQNPIVATVFYVDEVTPGYNTGGYYDQDIPEERRQVSPSFECDGQCYEWIDMHDPDKGNYFEIMKRHKRRTITERWWLPTRVASFRNK